MSRRTPSTSSRKGEASRAVNRQSAIEPGCAESGRNLPLTNGETPTIIYKRGWRIGGSSSVVERQLPKLDIASSSLVSRSLCVAVRPQGRARRAWPSSSLARRAACQPRRFSVREPYPSGYESGLQNRDHQFDSDRLLHLPLPLLRPALQIGKSSGPVWRLFL